MHKPAPAPAPISSQAPVPVLAPSVVAPSTTTDAAGRVEGGVKASAIVGGETNVAKAADNTKKRRDEQKKRKIADTVNAAVATAVAGQAIVDDVGSDSVNSVFTTGRRNAINEFIAQASYAAPLGLDTCYGSGVRDAFTSFVDTPGRGTADRLVGAVFEAASTVEGASSELGSRAVAYRGAPVIMEALALARAKHPE